MKEQKKLGILAAVFLVLVIILSAVLIKKHIDKKNIDSQFQDHIVNVCNQEELKSLSVTGAKGDKILFTFNDSHAVTKITYNGREFSDSMLNSSEVNGYLDQILHFSFRNSIDAQPGDDAKYGFNAPSYTVSCEKKDGSTIVYSAGDLLSTKNGVYARMGNEDKVYVADYSLYQKLSSRFEDFLNRRILNLERSDVKQITFERASTKDRWVVKPLPDKVNGVLVEARYQVSYPMDREANSTMKTLLSSLLRLQISQYVPIAEEDMASYGLNDPEYTFDILLNNGEEIKLSLSMELGGYYYGVSSNTPYSFRVSPATLPGMNLRSFDLIDSYVIHGYLNDVSKVEVTIKDTSFVLDCRLDKTMSFENENTLFQLDQRNAKIYSSQGECYGLLLFGSIFNMPVSRVDYEASPELKNVEATIHVVKNTSEIIDLKLVPLGDSEYYCFINGRYSGFIVDRSVLYKDNGYDMSDFGIWDAYCLATEAIDKKNKDNIYDRP
ncbi:MAG: DUF4340 domain-containing protein [Clostridiales bacterium]|nr:DUF4340 domain-containing protein [Clostridiales bacterium]